MQSSDTWVFVVAFLLSAGITGVMKLYAQRANLLDVPNERSSHEVATPRGGGLSIVVTFLGAASWFYFVGDLPTNVVLPLLVGGVLVAGIGFLDDHKHVPAKWRFAVQLFAASFTVWSLGGLPAVRFGGAIVDLGLIGDGMAVLFTVWLINLYNFMDGIDGIAAVEALCVVGGALLLLTASDIGLLANPLLVFAAAVSGFLVWNWPPAKIFMGDVGSGFTGFVLALFALVSSDAGLLPIWSWLILAGVFVVDATVTLATRMITGERWYLAHNNHAYQKASRRLQGHRPVVLAVLVLNLVWLLPIAGYAAARPEFAWWLTALAWAPLVGLALYFGAGRPASTE